MIEIQNSCLVKTWELGLKIEGWGWQTLTGHQLVIRKDLISYGMRKLCRIWASFCSIAWRSNITVTSQLWICLFSVSYYRWNSTKVTESTLPPIPSLKIKINLLEFAVTLTERMGMTLCYGITNPRKPLKNLVIVGGVALTLYAKIV